MIDTCQAITMYSKFYSPNILATGSSQLAENSYSVNNVLTNVLNGADPTSPVRK
jgi:glycosylphosphatidylinositol transamidase (GPIT) subunit GPI8